MSIEEQLNKAKEIADRSGNSFHYKVVNFLRTLGWTTLVSPYYTDGLTDKPREIDIIVEKEYPLKDVFGNWVGTVNVKLFIECKYINNETIFWFDEKDSYRALQRVKQDTHIEENSGFFIQKQHHYLFDVPVAKLFATSPDKNQENEVVYKALNQSLNALIYYRNSQSIIQRPENHRVNIVKRINLPVVVCNNFEKMFRIENGDTSTLTKLDDNFQIEMNYVSGDGQRQEYFLVDVVSFNNFKNYIDLIEKTEIKNIREFASWELRSRNTE